MIIPEPNFDFDVLPVWYSELNYYMTKYSCNSLEELDIRLWCTYGLKLVIL